MAITQSVFTEHLTASLQEMAQQRLTGLLHIERTEDGQIREQGEVYFHCGEIMMARAGQREGTDALTSIQSWRQIRYTFHEDATVPLHSTTTARREPLRASSTMHTTTTPYRRSTNPLPVIQAPQPKITRPLPQVHATPRPAPRPTPSQAVPVPAPQASSLPLSTGYPGVEAIFCILPSVATSSTMRRLERRERVVFALLDGRRTIRDVTRLTHQTEISVARIVAHLFQHGYVEYIRG